MHLKVLGDSTSDQSTWYDEGLQFTCSQCGNCCTGGPGFVWVSREEIVRLGEFLQITPEQVVERYCRRVDGRFTLREVRTPQGLYDCIFLREMDVPKLPSDQGAGELPQRRKMCSVYSVRPLQCRTWPFWPENLVDPKQWNRAAKRCHGMNNGRSFTRSQIESVRDAADWPKDGPTSK